MGNPLLEFIGHCQLLFCLDSSFAFYGFAFFCKFLLFSFVNYIFLEPTSVFLIVCINIYFAPFSLFSGISQLIVGAGHVRVVPLTVCSVKVDRYTVCSDG